MLTMSESVRLFAEEPESLVSDPPLPGRRIRNDRFCLVMSPSPSQSTVSRVRTSAEGLDGVVAEIRDILKAAGYQRAVWLLGPSSRPEGLSAHLKARGFVPATRPPFEPESTAMAISTPPARPRGDVEARQVRDYDEFVVALRLGLEAFGESEADIASWMATAPALWAEQDGITKLTHIAFVDGRPAGFAFTNAGANGLLLGGSAVLPAARGRGAYRALVAARWDEGVRLGKPALVIHASAMSRPILERCGFEAVCRIEALDDPVIG
jgi:hypothetical protein